MTARHIIDMLTVRGSWGIVDSDLPDGMTLDDARALATAEGAHVLLFERRTPDGPVPALRVLDARERAARRHAAEAADRRRRAALDLVIDLDARIACSDGEVVIERIEIHPPTTGGNR